MCTLDRVVKYTSFCVILRQFVYFVDWKASDAIPSVLLCGMQCEQLILHFLGFCLSFCDTYQYYWQRFEPFASCRHTYACKSHSQNSSFRFAFQHHQLLTQQLFNSPSISLSLSFSSCLPVSPCLPVSSFVCTCRSTFQCFKMDGSPKKKRIVCILLHSHSDNWVKRFWQRHKLILTHFVFLFLSLFGYLRLRFLWASELKIDP